MQIEELAKLLNLPGLPSQIEQVNKVLAISTKSAHTSIAEAGARVISAPSKRLRPMLVLAAAASDKEPDEDLFKAAAAIELVHLGTVVHDDIIDNAHMRWGAQTINAREGINHAILVGDYFLSMAAYLGSTVSAEIGQIVANALAVVCSGQALEVSDEFNPDRTLENYLHCISEKTAQLTEAAVEIGGVWAGQSEIKIQHLAKFGQAFGMSYQIIDDILDLVSTTELMGKPVGNDISEGVYTLPVLYGLAATEQAEVRELLGSRDPSDQDKLLEILISSGSVKKAVKQAKEYCDAARAAVPELPLAHLPNSYLNWAISQKARNLPL